MTKAEQGSIITFTKVGPGNNRKVIFMSRIDSVEFEIFRSIHDLLTAAVNS